MPATPTRSRKLAPIAFGALIVAGFFLPWTAILETTGWELSTRWGEWQYFVFPAAGLALIAAALLAPRFVPAVAMVVGGAITAWTAWHVTIAAADAFGWGITMVVAGSVFAVAGALIGK